MERSFKALAVCLPLLTACARELRYSYLGEARRARQASEAVLEIVAEERTAAYRRQGGLRPERVAEQAAADFHCPIEELLVEPVYFGRSVLFGASGCDTSGLYAATPDSVYAAGPRSSLIVHPLPPEAPDWHPGGGIEDLGPRDLRQACNSPSVRACAAARLRCPAESLAVADVGQGRWETAGCGGRAIWTPIRSGWVVDQ